MSTTSTSISTSPSPSPSTPTQTPTPLQTFHLFPHLLPELRTLIWTFASRAPRTIRIHSSTTSSNNNPDPGYYTRTPAPAITRANRESRTRSSYKRSFTHPSSERYIWTNFTTDTIHVLSTVFWNLESLPLDEIVHLRIELLDERGEEVVEDWWHHHLPLIPSSFPALKTVDLLVPRELRFYCPGYIEDAYFGEGCSKEEGGDVRIVRLGTGEWVDGGMVGVYADWVESFGGVYEEGMTRVVEWDVDEGTRRERMEDVRALEMPRPRVDLGYP
ncbi:hypothetical protein ONS95_000735 [Cadophora gregata]|uniref:uncharacterized protein n=1 Tax=Cadophora gregata TaxID=51156 RepID=UPI0026DA816D|nr:uncharacterized protein ONS95_000735 [Cadophora gregata]KAK0128785.1 hypothetical protein ONS95_000735 [Cadophora gregata]